MRHTLLALSMVGLVVALAPGVAAVSIAPVGAELCRDVSPTRTMGITACLAVGADPAQAPKPPQPVILCLPPGGLAPFSCGAGVDGGTASATVTIRVRPGSI